MNIFQLEIPSGLFEPELPTEAVDFTKIEMYLKGPIPEISQLKMHVCYKPGKIISHVII